MNYELRKEKETTRALRARLSHTPYPIPHTSYFIPHTSSRGFALLFTIMASSVLLAVAIAIFNLALREVVLSSYGRESQIAFYMADTGAECALYWDMKGFFATSTDSVLPSPNQIICGNDTITPTLSRDSHSATTNFSIPTVCTEIIVAKDDPGTGVITTIDSRGHNTCVVTDPLRVERGLRVNY